jgi:hypothetical protein
MTDIPLISVNMSSEFAAQGAPPDLAASAGRQDYRLKAGTSYQIGRDPQAYIVVVGDRVSRIHGELRWDAIAWTYADPDSKNGSFRNGGKAAMVTITADQAIRLGDPSDGSLLRCAPVTDGAPAPEETSVLPAQPGRPADAKAGGDKPREPVSRGPLPTTKLRIGRDPRLNDRVVNDPLVSQPPAPDPGPPRTTQPTAQPQYTPQPHWASRA